MGNLNSMTISTFVSCAKQLPAGISIMVRGPHGIGKSQIFRQLHKHFCEEDKVDYVFIDRRLSQMSEGDMVGLPSTDGAVTRFNPPDWYKLACEKPCVLLLDELNRATQEVMQAAFQIVLDRELNGWQLHPQTRVYTAVNASAEYTVNEVDPALLDRFWVIDLDAKLEDWLAWASDNVNELCHDFIQQNEKFLDPPKTADPTDVHSSRRSWERVDRVLEANGLYDEPENPMFYHLTRGFVGTDAATAFHDFCKNADTRITPEDILNKYTSKTGKLRKKIKDGKLGQEKLNAAIDKVSEYLKKTGKLSDKQGKNLRAFMDDLPDELKINLWTHLTRAGSDKLELAKQVHAYCCEAVLNVFGVKMGEAGVGMTPNIPGLFKKD